MSKGEYKSLLQGGDLGMGMAILIMYGFTNTILYNQFL
ncbi:MAG: hypothetical protein JETT_3927 [Candidatus Jettenia ecosi]|uniref:Uncharacterized protein n=1 Tax=Candidatus Jettenia ecosi TaxID=2494326 RepID=A0A533QGX4_9BACT|nr:MAG: hypothetical protein JETT_3927 [Candidatus Jettenia ecosi]